MGKDIFDIGFGNDLLDMTPKEQEKAKIEKQDYIDLKSFCLTKKTINKLK